MDRAHVSRSIRALLAGLIDYAGLFPPASLAMADAVSRYARYRRGPHAWMLGRFILPRAQIEEFEALAQGPMSERDAMGQPWRLSVLATDDLVVDYPKIAQFNVRHREAGDACIDTIEVKFESPANVARIADFLPQVPHMWFEASPGPMLRGMLQAMKKVGAHVGAKLRTGGVVPNAIPEAGDVAYFLVTCARAGVMCKATAGLHHPIHAPHRLTYADDSPTAMMHGFVNVFLAAVFARELVRRGREDAEIKELLVTLLDERDAHRIVWHDDHVAWRGHRLDLESIAAAREQFASSFGSCSFDEPIEDLTQLGWL